MSFLIRNSILGRLIIKIPSLSGVQITTACGGVYLRETVATYGSESFVACKETCFDVHSMSSSTVLQLHARYMKTLSCCVKIRRNHFRI